MCGLRFRVGTVRPVVHPQRAIHQFVPASAEDSLTSVKIRTTCCSEVFLDSSSGEPMLSDARQAWLDAQQAGWGDPARLHRPGRLAAQALDQAREVVAAAVGARPDEVVFTASAAHSNQAASRRASRWAGAASAPRSSRRPSITRRYWQRQPQPGLMQRWKSIMKAMSTWTGGPLQMGDGRYGRRMHPGSQP